MNDRESKRISKFLSLVLRHAPETIGVTLDAAGWIDVDELLTAAASRGKPISRDQLDHVVHTNDKRRFAFSDDGRRIRAQQGHSVDVEYEYQPVTPPPTLYHGTATRNLEAIRAEGLKPMSRTHVHLSGDHETAVKVGQRHGKPIVLLIDAAEMHRNGHAFFRTPNDVWLVECVPSRYLGRNAQT